LILCSGEVAKLFADAGFICIACLISPYRRDRAECRAMLPSEDFVEVGASPAYDLSNYKCSKLGFIVVFCFLSFTS
jgi:adenylylsulfate kinase-like enzyme